MVRVVVVITDWDASQRSRCCSIREVQRGDGVASLVDDENLPGRNVSVQICDLDGSGHARGIGDWHRAQVEADLIVRRCVCDGKRLR